MSNSSDERSPRFTKAIFGRIVAVIGFIGLGTFAVIQSVTSHPPETANTVPVVETQNQNEDGKTPDPDKQSQSPIAQTAKPGNSFDANPAKKKPSVVQNSLASSGFDMPKPKKFDSSSFPKPKTSAFQAKAGTKPPATLPKTGGGAFGGGGLTDKPIQSKSVASTPPSLRPKTASTPVVVAKPQTTGPPKTQNFGGPPQTQSFGGPPKTQSFGGPPATQSFGGPAKAPITTPPSARVSQLPDNGAFGGRPMKPIQNKLNDAASSASQFGANLRDSASSTLNSANKSLGDALQGAKTGINNMSNAAVDTAKTGLNTAKSGINSAAQSIQNGFSGNPLAPRPSTTQPSATKPPVTNSVPSRLSGNFGNGSSTKPPSTLAPRSTFPANPVSNTSSPTTRRPLTPPSSPPPRQQPTRRSFSNVSTPINNNSPLGASSPVTSAASNMTLPTPGDRDLEGMQAPTLTIEKLAPREIQVDQPADFEIVVRNAGRVTAKEVRVYDQIPNGTQFVSASPQAARGGTQNLQWNLGEIRPGQEKRIKLQLKPIRPGEIGSVAHLTFASQASMRTRVTKPVLQVSHSSQPKVLIGDQVVFDIVVENKGDGPATNVMLEEDVPQQLTYFDGTRELERPLGTLGPGQSRKLQLQLKAAEIGKFRNVLIATASGNLRSQHAIDMEVVSPRLITGAMGPKRRFLQREVTHEFSVENKGTADATNVELIARLPGGLKFVDANNRGKYDPNTHAVYWSLAELTPNVVGKVELKTLPIEAGEQEINFEALADLNQKSQATQLLLVEHLIDVFFDIDDVVDPIEIGSPTRYQVRIVNQGTKTATNVRLQVDFPNGIQPVSVDGNLPNEVRGQQVLFAPITSMNPGDELKLIVNAKGTAAGDHRVAVRLQTDGRATPGLKEETTRVYDDR